MTSAPGTRPLVWLRVRLCFVAVVMTALLGAIGYKAWKVQIVDGARLRALGQAQYLHQLEVPAPRGSIVDANGVELAVSVAVDSIYADPKMVVEPTRTARLVARALDLPFREVDAKLATEKRFVWLKRRVTPEEARRIRELGLPGIAIAKEWKRHYPGRELAGTVIGLISSDGRGIEGVELAHDDVLRGDDARLPVLRDARGGVLVAGGLGEGLAAPAPSGATVTLTIDRFIQYTAERALADALKEHKARAGVVVVLDARSGEILALAASPNFDPNDPRTRGEARNRPVTDVYEPGSTMKVFTIAAALEDGAVKATDYIDVESGRIQIGTKTIRDTHFERRMLTVTEVMKHSSNVGTVKIARRLGREKLAEWFRRFGFGSRTGVDLPGERTGVVRDPRRWGEIGLATGAFGYGLTVTPLQLAAGMVAVANGGIWYRPTIVKRVTAADGRVLHADAPEGRRILRPETSRALVDMLKAVMEKGGTGEKIKVPGFVVAGKTGTAHKVDPRTGKYAADLYLASFLGFAPADDPRIVILVMIDEPRGKKYFGGQVAGPVFARVASEALKYLGVAGTAPVQEPAAASAGAGGGASGATGGAVGAGGAGGAGGSASASPPLVPPVDQPEPVAVEDAEDLPPAGPGEAIVLIPDFTGMSMAQAVSAAAAAGVRIEIEGSGRAVKQFPSPGRALKSITCRITFDPG